MWNLRLKLVSLIEPTAKLRRMTNGLLLRNFQLRKSLRLTKKNFPTFYQLALRLAAICKTIGKQRPQRPHAQLEKYL